jgi:hypothetical protein
LPEGQQQHLLSHPPDPKVVIACSSRPEALFLLINNPTLLNPSINHQLWVAQSNQSFISIYPFDSDSISYDRNHEMRILGRSYAAWLRERWCSQNASEKGLSIRAGS